MVGDREHAANRPRHAARAGLNPRGMRVGHLRVRDEWLRTIAETEGRRVKENLRDERLVPVLTAAEKARRRAEKRTARPATAIRAMAGRGETLKTVRLKVTEQNPLLDGWANYFCSASVRAAFSALRQPGDDSRTDQAGET